MGAHLHMLLDEPPLKDVAVLCDHWIFWDEPAAFHGSLQRVLARLDSQSPARPSGQIPPSTTPAKLRKRGNVAKMSTRL